MSLSGPGTHLKRMLSNLGFRASSSCTCRQIMVAMDRDGPDGTEARRKYYVNRILQSAKTQEWDFDAVSESKGLQKLLSVASVVTLSVTGATIRRRVAEALVDRAIEKARNED